MEVVPDFMPLRLEEGLTDVGGLFHEVEGDGAIAGQLDIGDGLRHELFTLGIGIKQGRGWHRLVRQVLVDDERCLFIEIGIGSRTEL